MSIVIPLIDHTHHAYVTLQHLIGSDSAVPFEVVVVDSGSADQTPALLQQLENVRVLSLGRAMSFGEASNRGAQAARGDYVCLLDGRNFPRAEWLTEMLRVFSTHPHCGAIGGKTISLDGALFDAGGIVWEDGSTTVYGRGDDPSAPAYNSCRPVDYCSPGCLLVRSDLFRRAGGFDAGYSTTLYQTLNLCMWLAEAGHAVMYAPRSLIEHVELGKENAAHAIALELRDRKVFVEAWRHRLRGRGWPGAGRELLRRDTREGRRLLIIDDRVPDSRFGSGFPRTYALLEALTRAGFVISYLPTVDARSVEPVTSKMQDLGIEVLCGVTDVVGKIAERAPVCDAVIVSRPNNARYMQHVVRSNPNAVLIYDTESVYALREARRAESRRAPWSAKLLEKRIAEELAPVELADLVLTVSEFERQAVARHFAGVSTAVWGHAIDARPGSATWEERQDLLFVGYLESAPNDDAVVYFLETIMPRIREHVPCRLILVGDGASARVRTVAAQRSESVILAGFVDELDTVFGAARVFVAPHRFAAGIPLKVVEAMANGVPCVISQLLSELLSVSDGVEAMVAANESEFVQKVVDVYRQRELWERLRASGLEFVRTAYDPVVMEHSLSECLNRAIEHKTRATNDR